MQTLYCSSKNYQQMRNKCADCGPAVFHDTWKWEHIAKDNPKINIGLHPAKGLECINLNVTETS